MYTNLTFRVPTCVITDQALQLSARMLLITLYSCCNKHRVVTKTIRSIAHLTGLSTHSVWAGLRTLEAAGYIYTTHHKKLESDIEFTFPLMSS